MSARKHRLHTSPQAAMEASVPAAAEAYQGWMCPAGRDFPLQPGQTNTDVGDTQTRREWFMQAARLL